MPDGFEPQRTGRERTHNIPGPHLRDARGMEEQAREARSERPRRALDHQIQQSQAEGGWRAAGRSRILPLERGLGWHLLVRAVPVTENGRRSTRQEVPRRDPRYTTPTRKNGIDSR